ncbi:hypothetical protein GCM10009775_25690 [Microbacterium aoyamense]|uniref:PPM-type phosphatase domain-containing protein n=1 Tax=Microbacterium aoyamense TaxID=344166 RepID=A0ABN2PV05_9MICO|nr:SpoIIE family protein phosphatase [Microbacterium aoyamense]
MIRLDVGGASDVGAHRTVNQDAAFTAPWGAGVADGVGGGPSGDLASATLLHRLVAGSAPGLDAEQLAEMLRIANWDLRARVERDGSLRGMATTFTGIFVGSEGDLLLAHAGDSRAYLLRHGGLRRETRDDSYVQALVDRGLVAPEAAQSHPQRNIIMSSFAGGEADQSSVATREARVGDRWMLCSDGLTDYVPEPDVAGLLERGTPSEAARAAVNLALEAGTRDNVTVLVCDVVEGPPHPERPVFYGSAANRFTEELGSASA